MFRFAPRWRCLARISSESGTAVRISHLPVTAAARYTARLSTSTTAATTAAPFGTVYDTPVLEGSCGCGAVGWRATGHSALNFVCHCSVCRAASGQDAVPAAGFKPEQVSLRNREGMEERLPHGSRNTRMYCKSCGDYVAEDATTPLGVMALPLAAAATAHHRAMGCAAPNADKLHLGVDVDAVPEEYRPNHHIFYADRVQDVDDGVPKWKTLPQSELLEPGAPVDDAAFQRPLRSPSPFGRDGASSRAQYDAVGGRFRKDVLPASPVRPPYPKEYVFTHTDPIPNHSTYVSPEKVQERKRVKYDPSPGAYVAPAQSKRDVIIIGGGHNGLVSAAYLAKAGLDVLVLERRHLVGGAAVSEEIVPGFTFSRASYLAGLLRPSIIEDLDLHHHGFKYLPRDPSSFTPSLLDGPYGGKSLLLGSDAAANHASISQFSARDADAFEHYEAFLDQVREVVQPLLDAPLPDPTTGSVKERMAAMGTIKDLVKVGYRNREALVPFYELFTGPATHILDRWFESEMLKTTLATDAVIGAHLSPSTPGSAYVLLHHVMGEAAGRKGVWAYVEGGMGRISEAIAASARGYGAEIVCNATVDRILYDENNGNRVTGVAMADGSKLHATTVMSNATPYHTFLELLPGLSRDSGNADEASPLSAEFQHHIRFADHNCGAFKINCAVDKLPNFACMPSPADGSPGPHHHGTVHFENRMAEIEHAFRHASMGMPAQRPVVEMTIPSALDKTISPPGKHVVQLFVQFAPYHVDPKYGNWADPSFKNAFADRVFGIVDEFCPGFSSSVIDRDVLSALDLERIFGLHAGNIFHGALSLHQLAYARPMAGYAQHRIKEMPGLYLAGSGAHPGGGVMGSAGRNAAQVVLHDLGK